ncbi:dephospho-CoA kinase [Mucilaginibacter sp. PPCGB 2223]|uniref:dephospho-CoA kinase n=1 Tax=Mucilaginibacter sp. PPCGB 2223 TaxID=1886027 RepID=UPI000ABC2155|nr:dephospho-CoA kinase [Mucilaginibacter sp. PPCGB 2223]
MLKIGITGGIGSGKSTISKVFEVLGIPVFYADDAAKEVMTADPVLISALKETFGDEAYFSDGSLNRKYIANIVFNDPQQLAKLNAITHPAVFRAFDTWLEQTHHAPYVMKEAALMFESGSAKLCDKNILVYAPLAMRIDRVVKRDNLSKAEVESRNARQFTDEQKMKLADYVITNDDSQLVIPQVLALHQQFLTMAAGK